jgi:hypothetical protein
VSDFSQNCCITSRNQADQLRALETGRPEIASPQLRGAMHFRHNRNRPPDAGVRVATPSAIARFRELQPSLPAIGSTHTTQRTGALLAASPRPACHTSPPRPPDRAGTRGSNRTKMFHVKLFGKIGRAPQARPAQTSPGSLGIHAQSIIEPISPRLVRRPAFAPG